MWLRLGTTSEWITLPFHIYINCFSTFEHSRLSSLLHKTMEVGWATVPEKQLGTIHTTMTWLRPRTTQEWITLPSYIYIKFLFTFQCSESSYGCILTSSKPWRWTELAESGSQLDTKYTTTTMTWLWPRTTSDWITLPSYIYKVFKHLTMQWMFIWIHPYFIRALEVGWAGLNLSNKWV